MDTLGTIIKQNGGRLRAIAPDETVLAAAQRMNDDRIGSLLVMQGSTLVGIFTERDILTRVVAAKRDPAKTAVATVMTPEPLTSDPKVTVSQAREIMRSERIRHLPVCDCDGVIGMISMGDLNAFESQRLHLHIDSLESYITGS
jgi:CBS domain-containing protein